MRILVDVLWLLACFLVLLAEPIVEGILKERIDFKEIRSFYKSNIPIWWGYFKEVL